MPRDTRRVALFICEKYYLRFFRPVAASLAAAGFRPIWVAIDGPDEWPHEWLEAHGAVERLAALASTVADVAGNDGPALCRFEDAVFADPELFRANYSYTVNVVRSLERARPFALAWSRATAALLARFKPAAVFVWNGRYLPYSAVSHACEQAGQLLLTGEIGWVPGTIFLDRGPLSGSVADLHGRGVDRGTDVELGRADKFLKDYVDAKATMVSQRLVPAAAVRREMLGPDGRFLLVYGCQVDWDTNIVIGARRFRSNAAAVSFLMEAIRDLPGVRLVVKTHPLDSTADIEQLRSLVAARGQVVTDLHPHALIEAADCVAIRNSTLGFETLCYEKPLLLLEPAKYRDPDLTLDARDQADIASQLTALANGTLRRPDPIMLRRMIVHLLDHYLVPVTYEYFFKSEQLKLLSHFDQNDSLHQLRELLQAAAPVTPGVRPEATEAIASCVVHRPAVRSRLVTRLARKVASWTER